MNYLKKYNSIIYNNFYIVLFCFGISIFEIIFSFNYFLDDAFIHHRIASNILSTGHISYSGINLDFSTSSILYTGILSFFSYFYNGLYLTKFLSIFFYFLCFSLISLSLLFVFRSEISKILGSIWLLSISSPLGIRWLTDGMETSFIAVLAISLGIAFFRSFANQSNKYYSFFILGLFSVLLRVEFTFIILWIFSVNVLIQFIDDHFHFNFRTLFLRNIGLLFLILGALVGLSSIYWIFGSILPDTAVAKSPKELFFNVPTILMYLYGIAKSHVSSSFFGISGFAILTASILYIIRYNFNYKIVLVNTSFFCFLILIVSRLQLIQGYRYFIFIEYFLISFNLYYLSLSSIRLKLPKYKIYIFIMAISAWFFFDLYRFHLITSSRAATFLKFKNNSVLFLKNKSGLAWDVGMIGFFSGANILDPNGLVNGRDFAKLDRYSRLNYFLSHNNIDFIFANQSQLDEIELFVQKSDWIIFDTYDFPNFSNDPDTHYLLIKK